MNDNMLNSLWEKSDALRGNVDVFDYKHIVLGLIFLKYISDAFDRRHQVLVEEGFDFEEDIDAYTEENIFFVPKEARWNMIRGSARRSDIGTVIDDAMRALEKNNTKLKGVLPIIYGRKGMDKTKLGDLIDLFSFDFSEEDKNKDIFGQIYEYFLKKFGLIDGVFFTPSCLVDLLVELLEPYSGRVYDPCCGTGGMFVQSAKFIEEHQGRIDKIHIYGQEINASTWKLCKMNLAVRHLDADLGISDGDTFHNDMHKILKADFILANPPFGIKNWGADSLKDDVRWKYGVPKDASANFAWIQHIVSKLSPLGKGAVILSDGCATVDRHPEAEIRSGIIDDDLIDCVIQLPAKLFSNTPVSCSVWILSRDKAHKKREHKGETLFIDASKMGQYITKSRSQIELSEQDIDRMVLAYHSWESGSDYEDVPGFCKATNINELKENNYYLQPGRFVGLKEITDNQNQVSLKQLLSNYDELVEKSSELDVLIKHGIGEYLSYVQH